MEAEFEIIELGEVPAVEPEPAPVPRFDEKNIALAKQLEKELDSIIARAEDLKAKVAAARRGE